MLWKHVALAWRQQVQIFFFAEKGVTALGEGVASLHKDPQVTRISLS